MTFRNDPFHPSNLNPIDFQGKILSTQEILNVFNALNAAWVHDGDPQRPHAELTSGNCSNGFFDCLRVLCYPNLCEILAQQLARKLKAAGIGNVDWVIGSPYAAITFSYEIAKALGAVHSFVEKDPEDPKKKKMLWQRATIPAGSIVLQIEELITTSGTFKEVRRAVTEGNTESIEFLPFVGCLVHRPPEPVKDYDGVRVVTLVEKVIWAVPPEQCHLCKAGSKRVRPKTHWNELVGKVS